VLVGPDNCAVMAAALNKAKTVSIEHVQAALEEIRP
jgi:hypothetical protein